MARLRFEAEAQGTIVTALDMQDPSRTGFNVDQEILRADVTYNNVIETLLRP